MGKEWKLGPKKKRIAQFYKRTSKDIKIINVCRCVCKKSQKKTWKRRREKIKKKRIMVDSSNDVVSYVMLEEVG